jgi:hypothetical protein
MANVKLSQTAATALTISGLSSLASGSATANTTGQLDNTGNLYLDYLIEVSVTTGTVSGNKQCIVYACSSIDGTNFSDGTQSDNNMVYLGNIQTPTSTTAYRGKAMSVSAAFGGTLPPKFAIVVFNDGGGTYSAGTCQYVGSFATVV